VENAPRKKRLSKNTPMVKERPKNVKFGETVPLNGKTFKKRVGTACRENQNPSGPESKKRLDTAKSLRKVWGCG